MDFSNVQQVGVDRILAAAVVPPLLVGLETDPGRRQELRGSDPPVRGPDAAAAVAVGVRRAWSRSFRACRRRACGCGSTPATSPRCRTASRSGRRSRWCGRRRSWRCSRRGRRSTRRSTRSTPVTCRSWSWTRTAAVAPGNGAAPAAAGAAGRDRRPAAADAAAAAGRAASPGDGGNRHGRHRGRSRRTAQHHQRSRRI